MIDLPLFGLREHEFDLFVQVDVLQIAPVGSDLVGKFFLVIRLNDYE